MTITYINKSSLKNKNNNNNQYIHITILKVIDFII